MALSYTENYNLTLQQSGAEASDKFSMEALNENARILDEELKKVSNKAFEDYISLEAGDDINTIKSHGMYRSASSTITNSLLNAPSIIGNNGFAMEVFSAASYPTTIQRITWGGYSTFMPNCIMRCGRPVNGVISWGAWYQVAMTEVVEEVSAE